MADFSISRCIREYRNNGFDDESIGLATEDLNAGKSTDYVGCYMNIRIDKPYRIKLAKALHDGMSLELGKKISGMDMYQIAEVMTRVEERMPFDVIEKVIENNPSSKHMEYAFEKIKQLMLNKAETVFDDPEESDKDTVKEEKQTEVTEDKSDTTKDETPVTKTDSPAAEQPVKKEPEVKPEPVIEPEIIRQAAEPESAPVVPMVSAPAPQPVPAADNSEMIEKFGNIFAKSITDIMTQNSIMMERVIAASEERTQKVLDKMLEKEPAVTATTSETVAPTVEKTVPSILEETPVPKTEPAPPKPEEPEIKPAMHKEAEKEDAPFRYETKPAGEKKEGSIIDSLARAYEEWHPEIQKTPAPEKTSVDPQATAKRLAAYHEQTVQKMPSEVDGVMKMVRMQDGTVCPVFIEHTKADKPRGILGLCAKLFGKNTKQNALLTMLIDKKLDPGQLKQIHNAVIFKFSDDEIRDLINSGLSADEMKGIVDVIFSDKRRKKR